MAVRSKQLGAGRLSTASLEVVYTVPSGETAIVKSFDFTNLSTSSTAKIVVGVDVPGFDNTLYFEQVLAAREGVHHERWLVLPAGASIGLIGPGTPAINYWISGAELLGVAD